jgi:NAD(P)-dependent dehydrogenase (short-subunit alcohol dehydrogenase family)
MCLIRITLVARAALILPDKTKDMKQSDKVWFITGASKGFGLALVRLLLSNGNKIAATSRHAANLEKHFGPHPNLLPLTVDLANEESVNNAVQQSIEKFGRLDVVVNNAGYFILGSLEELSDQEFRQTMDINVFGTVNIIRAVMPYLREQRSGYIINLASTAGYIGYGKAGSYNASKFAVIGLSEALALEVAPFNVKVTVVAPGYFRTSFLEQGSVMVTKNKIGEYGTDLLENAMSQMNGHQPGDPDKLVAALVALAEEPNPPVHLLMGSDAYQTVTGKRQAEDQELESWKHITLSTNFDN